MKYNFTCTGIEVTPDVNLYLDKKLSHVEKFLHSDAVYKLNIHLQHHIGIEDKDKKCSAAFTLVINGTTIHTEAHGLSIYEAIDVATNDLAREAAQYKSKHKSLVRRGAIKAKEFMRGLRG